MCVCSRLPAVGSCQIPVALQMWPCSVHLQYDCSLIWSLFPFLLHSVSFSLTHLLFLYTNHNYVLHLLEPTLNIKVSFATANFFECFCFKVPTIEARTLISAWLPGKMLVLYVSANQEYWFTGILKKFSVRESDEVNRWQLLGKGVEMLSSLHDAALLFSCTYIMCISVHLLKCEFLICEWKKIN